jgi:2,4-dienoyl-CoA reductase-like NADH-dependent reductase (Old Yellow Enzyme family)
MHATPTLFSPFEMRGITARNRIVVSPMSQYAAPDGLPGDWHRVHLGKFALGGAGIVFCEETSVAANARKTTHCPGIYNEAQGLAWRRITDFLRANGALSAMQLGHAGRKVATLPRGRVLRRSRKGRPGAAIHPARLLSSPARPAAVLSGVLHRRPVRRLES